MNLNRSNRYLQLKIECKLSKILCNSLLNDCQRLTNRGYNIVTSKYFALSAIAFIIFKKSKKFKFYVFSLYYERQDFVNQHIIRPDLFLSLFYLDL